MLRRFACRALVVAHRLSTVKNADRIVVITDAGIREQLLRLDGYQFKNQ